MGVTERTVAGWILDEPLGSGGFAEVWRARKRHVDLVRAVKLTPVAGPRAFDSWRHEIGRLEALSHPNIVRFYDADIVTEEGPYHGYAWIATELCERSLAHELRDSPGHRLESAECERLVDQMLAALTAAHEDACVHRDVKPANILRHRDGSWKLCDFGTARLLPAGESHLHTTVIGTSPYMSAAAHRGRQDHAADLYALGVTLHEALCGERLHSRPVGMTDSEYVKLILDTDPSVAAGLSDRWRTVVRGLIGADGPTRTARELREWFRDTRGHGPLPPATEPTQAVANGVDAATAATDHFPDPGVVHDMDAVDLNDLPEVENLGKPTEVQPPTAGPAKAGPLRQVFVPAPPTPDPPPAPAPVHRPAPGPHPQGPRPQPPPQGQRDPWEPTAVLGRRAVAFAVDVALVWLIASLVWTAIYATMLLVAYDRPDSATVGDDPHAFCRSEIAQGRDCRVFTLRERGVYVRDEALWSSTRIGTLSATLVILYLWVLRQGRRGTTPGKRLTGIHTLGPDGRPPGRGRALVRTLLLVVDAFAWPYLLLSASTDGRGERTPQARRRVGDRVANTWVVRRKQR